jgi:hypothetical protein
MPARKRAKAPPSVVPEPTVATEPERVDPGPPQVPVEPEPVIEPGGRAPAAEPEPKKGK